MKKSQSILIKEDIIQNDWKIKKKSEAKPKRELRKSESIMIKNNQIQVISKYSQIIKQ